MVDHIFHPPSIWPDWWIGFDFTGGGEVCKLDACALVSILAALTSLGKPPLLFKRSLQFLQFFIQMVLVVTLLEKLFFSSRVLL